MYDSFDNMYQATIGIDFLSKVRSYPSRLSFHTKLPGGTNLKLTTRGGRPCTSRTGRYDYSCGTRQARSDSEA